MNPLAPLGWIFGAGTAVRNALYDRGIFRTHSLDAKTISVGNITTGGTGKTPLVAYIAELLARNREKVCILTRGYGRRDPAKRVVVSSWNEVLVDARVGGDEAVELANKLLGKAVVVADADRISAGRWAKNEFGITVFVLDDGFQHRRVKRDLDIVCVDATTEFGNGHLLPAGPLRETVTNIERADVIVVTRSDLSDKTDNLAARILSIAPDARQFRSVSRIAGLHPVGRDTTEEWQLKDLKAKRPFVFCGIGNPNAFVRQLEKEGLKIVGNRSFPDHHFYSVKDVTAIERLAASGGADALITTVKDAVKLKEMNFSGPCFAVLSEIAIDDEEGFERLLTDI